MNCLQESISELKQLIVEARLFAAKKRYHDILSIQSTLTEGSSGFELIHSQLEELNPLISQMLERVEEATKTIQIGAVDESWTLGMTLLGVTTHYKLIAEDGSITVRLEGLLEEFPLFEQTAVIHEMDLFSEW